MRMRWMAALLAAALGGPAAAAECPADALRAARAANWQVDDAGALALRSVACLGDPDPQVRDALAFDAFQAWMRGGKLDAATLQALRATLTAQLQAPDPQGVLRPFAALVLAEVARVDRMQPYLTPGQRQELVAAGAAYLRAVRDYRGFEQQAGWRHGVAHGADLMLQLSLNPALDKAAHQAMLDAIASQVMPAGAHFYQYGEGERLMAPVFYLARRPTLSCAEWDAWFAELKPALPATGQAGLAQRHNLKAFLLPLYLNLTESKDKAPGQCLLPLVLRGYRQASG